MLEFLKFFPMKWKISSSCVICERENSNKSFFFWINVSPELWKPCSCTQKEHGIKFHFFGLPSCTFFYIGFFISCNPQLFLQYKTPQSFNHSSLVLPTFFFFLWDGPLLFTLSFFACPISSHLLSSYKLSRILDSTSPWDGCASHSVAFFKGYRLPKYQPHRERQGKVKTKRR